MDWKRLEMDFYTKVIFANCPNESLSKQKSTTNVTVFLFLEKDYLFMKSM